MNIIRPAAACARRLLAFLLSVLLLSAAVFWASRLAPGDPLAAWYGSRVEKMTPEERARAEDKLGLNDPVAVQYVRWLSRALRGDFGISYQYKMDAAQVIRDRLGNTLILGGSGFALIFAGSLLLGMLCAWREDGPADRLICKIGTLSSCVPEFWLSLALILVFSVKLRWLPASGAFTAGGGGLGDRLAHLVLPLAVVAAGHLWYYAYMVRNLLLEQARADYVLLAKAKGLAKGSVMLRHCLRNALPAYLSLMAVSVPHILGGTYVVEAVFSYPGIGTLAYDSARYRDYNLLMLVCLLSGALVIASSAAAQAVSQRLDPRVRSRDRQGPSEVVRL